MIATSDKSKLQNFQISNDKVLKEPITKYDINRRLPDYMNHLMMDLYASKKCKLSKDKYNFKMQKILLNLHLITIKNSYELALTKSGKQLCKQCFCPLPKLKRKIHLYDIFKKLAYGDFYCFCISMIINIPMTICLKLSIKKTMYYVLSDIEVPVSTLCLILFLMILILAGLAMWPKVINNSSKVIWTTDVFKMINQNCSKPKQERKKLILDLKRISYALDN